MVDLWRDFWISETGTGQQVAQLHERYDDDDDDDDDTRYSGKYFQSSPSFPYIDYRKIFSFFFKSESKETALPRCDQYSQFHDNLVKFPAREKPRTLLQATWKIDTECN